MQTNQDILETQVANVCDSICQQLYEICADLQRLPFVVQEKMERQRHYDFYQSLLSEDTSMEVKKDTAAQNLADLFKSAELPPGQDARVVVRELFDKHEIKPNQQGPKL